jgi:hypothetical protein
MSQQSEASDLIRKRLADGPFPVATLVAEIRAEWGPGHTIESVHFFATEVVYALLFNDDIDVGDIHGGRFVSWAIDSLDAYDRIDAFLNSQSAAFEDSSSIVFQFMGPNQSTHPTPASGTPPAEQESRLRGRG